MVNNILKRTIGFVSVYRPCKEKEDI